MDEITKRGSRQCQQKKNKGSTEARKAHVHLGHYTFQDAGSITLDHSQGQAFVHPLVL